MTTYLKKNSVSTRRTSQRNPIPGRESEMVKNNAGGYTFQLSPLGALQRFLVLGTEGGTYYASERKHTMQATGNVRKVIQENGIEAVNLIVEVSQSGRAPKNDPALYALAMAAGIGDDETRSLALANLPLVARTGTHLFQFVNFVEDFRGWGRGLRNGIARWYEQDANRVALQAVKYRNREGYTHRDLLRLAHPKAITPDHQALFAWITQGNTDGLPSIVEGYLKAQNVTKANEAVALINEYGLPREALPTEVLTEASVWEALLENMPMTAMIRNLGNMSKVGLLKPGSNAGKIIRERLRDENRIVKARIHPIGVLSALMTYKQGHGYRGSGSWTAVSSVVDALEDAFYLSFGSVTPADKRTLLALDVSGSMSWGEIAGVPGLTPAVGAAVMAMVTARTEPDYQIMGFSTSFRDLKLSAKDSLDDAVRKTTHMAFGGTDCSVPMTWAASHVIDVDTFVVYTDNETWAGRSHPAQALQNYRRQTGIPAKLIVVGMTATNFTIADPKDGGMLDVVGFDTAAPNIINDFSAGRV